MKRKGKTNSIKSVETLTHAEAKRKNIPSAEHQSVMRDEDKSPIQVAYERRNRDLDPQLVWRGKDMQDWSDLVVQAPPVYIQERVHPKVLIDDLRRVASEQCIADSKEEEQLDLFGDFNGLPEGADKTDFYHHEGNWSNRMILGDSLQVMASLAEREGLRGQVQCIYLDPPYGIKFNSNFQWSTTSRDVKDGKADHITREPEQVKAFRDTWRDGIHSYLTYLRDRLMAARDLLTESGSIFVQIGDENVHRVRAVMDEVFGDANFVAQIASTKTAGQTDSLLPALFDTLLWYARDAHAVKFRRLYRTKGVGFDEIGQYYLIQQTDGARRRMTDAEIESSNVQELGEPFRSSDISSNKPYSLGRVPFDFNGRLFLPPEGRFWTHSPEGRDRLKKADRIMAIGKSVRFVGFLKDDSVSSFSNQWTDTGISGFAAEKVYVVQTSPTLIQRCLLMATDPGDLVLDPTCGSGTTAYVAEQWGRRWITIDTSRVALALARARIMGARYPFYLLTDSPEGQQKEAEITQSAPSTAPTRGNIRHGFVYERVPHVTLKSIANNAEIDVIWEKYQAKLEPLRAELNEMLGTSWEEWEIPRSFGIKRVRSEGMSGVIVDSPTVENIRKSLTPAQWERLNQASEAAELLLTDWWDQRIARQREIDASIAAKADSEYLYDKPYTDNKKVRVAGPFTVESLSPHRMLAVDENDELVDSVAEDSENYGVIRDFTSMILENLRMAGVQQAHKEDRIVFTSLVPWPGKLVCAEGRYNEGATERRAGILIGPEFGTVQRNDLVEAARECGEAGFDVLIACAFNFDAHSSEFDKLGKIPVLKARMNADLHMAKDLKATGKGNLFVIFGEPDITVVSEEWIVDSGGRRIAPYEVFTLVSGVDSLAEINGLDAEHLRAYAEISQRGEVWDYLANAAGGQLDSCEHRGRPGTAHDRGVSAGAWHCAGLTGGIRNLCDTLRKAGLPQSPGFRKLVDGMRGNQQNAPRAHEIPLPVTIHSPLSTIHSPLTTIHYAQVTVHGVDVFKPQTGEVVSNGPDDIACWFIDTDYNGESFFVRHAYFLGQNDPYKALKTTLKAEINEEAWDTLHSATSRPFEKPNGGRIAVKVINHLGDEVMKVYRV
jgi:adenine-specific DNA-methyltransferase